jgi:hypothetical protein
MIEPKFRWYHYTMISLKMQMIACVIALVCFLVQVIMYDVLEEDVVVFHDECTVEIGATIVADGVTSIHQGASAMCDGIPTALGELQTKYLYTVLTTDQSPVIVCKKTVSEYLHEVAWHCVMGLKENNT